MQYEIKVRFETDRAITHQERDDLLASVLAQVEEPVTYPGDDATYTTRGIKAKFDSITNIL